MAKTFLTMAIILIVNISFAQTDSILNFPDKYVLLETERPENFEIKIIDKNIIKKGFLGNPGYMSEELVSQVFFRKAKEVFF